MIISDNGNYIFSIHVRYRTTRNMFLKDSSTTDISIPPIYFNFNEIMPRRLHLIKMCGIAVFDCIFYFLGKIVISKF